MSQCGNCPGYGTEMCYCARGGESEAARIRHSEEMRQIELKRVRARGLMNRHARRAAARNRA